MFPNLGVSTYAGRRRISTLPVGLAQRSEECRALFESFISPSTSPSHPPSHGLGARIIIRAFLE